MFTAAIPTQALVIAIACLRFVKYTPFNILFLIADSFSPLNTDNLSATADKPPSPTEEIK